MPLRPHHLAVKVVDLEDAERFYAGVLGLPVERRWEDDVGRPRSLWMGLGDAVFLAVERAEDPSGSRRDDGSPGWHCVVLGIPRAERETWRRRLEVAGCPVERESPYTLYVRDPEGNLLGLSHWPEAA